MRITFAKQKRPSGLAGVCYQEENYDIKVDGTKKGVISKDIRPKAFTSSTDKYYWYLVSLGISRNTLAEGIVFETLEDAKSDVKNFLKKYFTEMNKVKKGV